MPLPYQVSAGQLFSTTFNDSTSSIRIFKALLSISYIIGDVVWEFLIQKEPQDSKSQHLLMRLYFLRNYNTENSNLVQFHISKKTFRRWIWRISCALGSDFSVCLNCILSRLFQSPLANLLTFLHMFDVNVRINSKDHNSSIYLSMALISSCRIQSVL